MRSQDTPAIKLCRINLRLLIPISILLGVFLGGGIALGDFPGYWNAVSGSYVYPELSHENTDPGYPDHSYDQDHFAWANSNYPGATEFRFIDTGHWNGWSSTPTNMWFHKLRIADEDGLHKGTSASWQCIYINGASEANSTSWEYDNFNGGNKNIELEQLIAINDCWDPGDINDPNISAHHSAFQVY